MSKLIILIVGVLAIGGCATKSSHIALDGAKSALVPYEDSKAQFSDVKGHRIIPPLTDTNSVDSAGSTFKDICSAFVVVANADGVSAVN